MSDYQGARAVLDAVFSGELNTLAAAIQEVIVEIQMDFKNDALRDLVELVNEHKELPSLCLLLGDLLETNERLPKAVQCWKLAVHRDQPGGAIALAAQRQLKRIENTK